MDNLFVLAALLFHILAVSQPGASSHTNGVCYHRSSRYITRYSTSTSYYTTAYNCGLFGWRRCRRTRSRSSRISQRMIAYYTVRRCCSGFTEAKDGTCTPVCNQGCYNGGTCTDPGVCTCGPYWTGNYCQTSVNECAENTHNCEQSCINTNTGFECDCLHGYRLNSDSRSCSEINECVEDTDGCGHNCHNNNGSYECSCNTGYKLGEDRHTCILAPPAAPLNVIVTEVTATSAQLEWSSPRLHTADGLAVNYTISCTQDGFDVWLSIDMNISTYTSVIIRDLQPFTNYTCCVTASNQAGEGDELCTTLLTIGLPGLIAQEADYETLLISGSVSGAGLVLVLVGIVIIIVACLRIRKHTPSKKGTSSDQQRTTEQVYDIPDDLTELKEKSTTTFITKHDCTTVHNGYRNVVFISTETAAAGTTGGLSNQKRKYQKRGLQNECAEHNQEHLGAVKLNSLQSNIYDIPRSTCEYANQDTMERMKRLNSVVHPEEENLYELVSDTSPQDEELYTTID